MILIADSGSTKTDWCFCTSPSMYKKIHTQGINPFLQQHDDIVAILQNELLTQIPENYPNSVSHICYYGAGCATENKCNTIRSILGAIFKQAEIVVESDLLGAARALCSNQEGIACVIGTGSNSCLYNGKDIVDNIPSLGYILGDEGSSVALGRTLLSDCLKRQMPPEIVEQFMQEYRLTKEEILESVYNRPLPNRYMAQFTPFISAHRDIPQIHSMITNCFSNFFTRNVIAYHKPWLPVNFVGSIANIFSSELIETAESLGMKTGRFMQSPIDGLVSYHLT